jgi:hypothetical protein
LQALPMWDALANIDTLVKALSLVTMDEAVVQ